MEATEKFSEKEIQRALIRDCWQRTIAFPNYTPLKWWECDVFELTKAGYFREYEIKTSRSDFFNDSRKCKPRWHTGHQLALNKHEQIAGADINGPSRFFFVAPDIIDLSEIPEWAGFIQVSRPFEHLRLELIKKAPCIHAEKFHATGKDDLMRTAYFRFQWQFLKTRDIDDSALIEYHI